MYSFGIKSKARRKFGALRQLLRSHDIVVLQELHGEPGDLQTLVREFPHCTSVVSFGAWAGVGGVAIIYKKQLELGEGPAAWEIIAEGRCICAHFFTTAGLLTIVNIHIDPNLQSNQKIALVHTIHKHIKQIKQVHHDIIGTPHIVILAGDFNFESKFGCRMDFIQGKEIEKYAPEADAFYELFHDYIEVAQPNFTRVQLDGDRPTSAGVLDHFYIQMCPLELMDLKPHSCTLHNVFAPNRLSDHTPIALTLHTLFHSPTSTPNIHPWIFKHPQFADEYHALLHTTTPHSCPYHNLRVAKECMQLAAIKTKHHIALNCQGKPQKKSSTGLHSAGEHTKPTSVLLSSEHVVLTLPSRQLLTPRWALSQMLPGLNCTFVSNSPLQLKTKSLR